MATTQDHKGLLKAIKRNPNDRVARLALADLYEERGALEMAQQQREVVALLLEWYTIAQVKEANLKGGYHWFAKETMRHFRSRVYPVLYIGTTGIFFVSSESFAGQPREYTIRQFDPATGVVDTHNTLGKYRTKARAVTAAKRAADGQE